jgi:hypothetical protein
MRLPKALLFLSLPLFLAAQTAPSPADPGALFEKHYEFLTRDGGEWVADNPDWKPEARVPKSFGLTFKTGVNKRTLHNVISIVMADGRKAAMWDLLALWDPREKREAIRQVHFSGAIVDGHGRLDGQGAHHSEMRGVFPDGSPAVWNHESVILGPDEFRAASFSPAADGGWKADTPHVFRRVKPAQR